MEDTAFEATIPEQPKVMQICVTLASKLNLADFQNAVPVARELSLQNDTDAEAKGLRLVVTSEPPFLKSKTWHIDHIGSGQSIRISDLDLSLDGTLLGRLTEAEKAVVTFSLTTGIEGAAEIAHSESNVELLPRNQWAGLSSLPDMIAAFVQPNEPAIERALKHAAEVLRNAGKPSAIDGYQGGPRRAWELVSAIWNAIGSMGLDYALPPASFEHTGQRVRSPSHVADSGLATCLDLSLFACAALEQAGLNSILVFTRGHAFAGVWLKSEEFATSVIHDVTALRKRVKLKEILLFETTLLTHRPLPALSYAISRGEEQISEENEQNFELAVDIRRARLQRIKPLASEQAIARGSSGIDSENIEAAFEAAPDLPDELETGWAEAALERPEDRLTRWQRKLLDLSLRNNLLCFKAGKKSLRLDAPDPGYLEDILADGHSLKLLTRPDLMDGNDPRSQAIHEGRERENVHRQHALDALKRNEVFVGLAQDEMESRLVELYRTARTTVQEGGSNTLYLALGFLSWNRDDKDDKKYRAPLILVPVSLDRRSARSGFSLKLYDDEARFNPTLLEMLRQDFELELGVHDTELPKDDHGLDVAGIWKTVSNAIKDVKGWEVVEDVVLATFSFAKYLMWKDLTERTEQLKLNAVVRHLIDTPRDSYNSTVEFPDARKLDVELPVKETYCPLPADSSQLSAVVAGSRGKDFVLIGPPGTGKSQTISNLIAQCLAERKRVLFVSEKMAALDVVYRRLADVGLGRFCLELHSNKARKTEVLEQLRTSWDATSTMAPEEWHAEAARLEALRAQLNGYVERLHLRHSNGLSVYEAIGKVVSGSDFLALHLSWPSAQIHDSVAMRELRETVELLDVHAKVMGAGELTSNPLAHIRQTEWSPLWQAALLDTARSVGPAVKTFEAATTGLNEAIGLPILPLVPRVREGLRRLAAVLPTASGQDWGFVLRPDAKSIVDGLRQAAPLLDLHRRTYAALSIPRGAEALENLRLGIGQLTRYLELKGQLPEPWNDSLRSRLALGVDMLLARQDLSSQLTLPYKDEIPTATVERLQKDLRELQEASWPMSMFRRLALARKLKELAASDAKPDIAGDIERLVKIDDLQHDLKKLDDLSAHTAGSWAGLKTQLDVVRAYIGYQMALALIRIRAPWDDVGLEPVSREQCGDAAKLGLQSMREMRLIDKVMAGLTGLGGETDSVWKGYETDLAAARAFVSYQSALTAVREGRSWQDEGFSLIDSGRAGPVAADDLKKMRELVSLQDRLQEFTDLSAKTSGLWNGLQTKIERVDLAVEFFGTLTGALASLAHTPDELVAVRAPIALLLGDGNILLEPTGSIAGANCIYAEALNSLNEVTVRFSLASGLPESDATTLGGMPPAQTAHLANDVLGRSNRLNAWCAWRKARQKAIVLGLSPLVEGLERGEIQLGRVRDAFETDYCRWWLNAVVDADEVLRTFVSAEHEKRIRDFRELDDRFINLTQAWVRAQLSADHPSPERVARGSEWGLLRYEMQKKTRHLPLRELMSQASGAVMRLTPCLLMSPLSIAQYLPAETANFDVVVFDEASQITVWDAIGAMARAKQVIMVGDPKQLPPTNFFNRAESDADDTDVEAELESILEECIGANLPTMKLSWHYRSRHESLIAFSNHRYYDGDLVTFPSPVTNDRAVSLNLVSNGQYERGGARTNKSEAKALVADLVGKLKAPGFRDSGLTIGVVTFNTEQQSLIEDLLDEERRKDPSIEPYFMESQLEPVFVKNLESVQGDERDVMYFSITYGPSIDGAMPMNFGPMNQQGGERRLNVAITRARQELRVFASFRPERMDLSRTQALGVRDLKHFLEFAERGARALGEAVAGSIGDFDSPFEQAVSLALTEKGWILHSQVGVSAFRIDLGVVDPDAPGRYLAGIECDGATYHRSASARDRDKLREHVLRGLGWEILRIWSTDWWIDIPGTVEKIHGQLKALLEEQQKMRVKVADEAELLAQQVIVDAMTSSGDAIVESAASSEGRAPPASRVLDPAIEPSAVYARRAVPIECADLERETYAEVDLALTDHVVDAALFFEESYDSRLLAMIACVVDVEGPVLDEVLARRIARAHSWSRTGARIQTRVVQLAKLHFRGQEEDIGIVFWPKSNEPGQQIQFRRPRDGAARAVDEIAFAELVSLAREMKVRGHDEEAGVVAMAKEIGLLKLRTTSRERLERAWADAIV
jgi:hypothetical protein